MLETDYYASYLHVVEGLKCQQNQQDRLISDLRERLSAAEAVIAKLPKMAEGLPITPGMEVWFQMTRNHGWQTTAEMVAGYYDKEKNWNAIDFDGKRFYSTREAAEAAKSKGAKDG